MNKMDMIRIGKLRNEVNVVITEYLDNIHVVAMADGEVIDDPVDGGIDHEELARVLNELDVDSSGVEPGCDGSALCGDSMDAADVEEAITQMGYVNVEHKTVDEFVRDEDDEDDEDDKKQTIVSAAVMEESILMAADVIEDLPDDAGICRACHEAYRENGHTLRCPRRIADLIRRKRGNRLLTEVFDER